MDFRKWVHHLSLQMHNACLKSLNQLKTLELSATKKSEAHSAAQALVCGYEIEDLSLKNLFTKTGLIHLLVVSGSHLLLMKILLDWCFGFVLNQLSKWLPHIKESHSIAPVLFCLFLYVLMCLMNPPVVRSFISILIMTSVAKMNLRWAPTSQQYLTSLVALFINPAWLISLSFQMSWLASLALDLASIKRDRTDEALDLPGQFQRGFRMAATKTMYIYLSFTFLFCYFGFPHPFVPIYSLVLSPVLEVVLFPMALLSTLSELTARIYILAFDLLSTLLQVLEVQRYPHHFLEQKTVTYINHFMISFLLILLVAKKKAST